jgi:hypothetical protein
MTGTIPTRCVRRRRRLLAVTLSLLPFVGACVSTPTSIAGSVPLPPDATRTLHVAAPQPKDIVVELWNRGPGRVTFRSVAPTLDATTRGELDPIGGDARWSIRAQEFAIELTADAAGASVGYTVRAVGSLELDTRVPVPPPRAAR